MSTFDAGAIEARLVLDRSRWNKDLTEAKKQAAELDGKELNVRLALDGLEELQALQAKIEEIDQESINVDFDVEESAELELLREQVDSLDGRLINVGVDADTGSAATSLLALETLVSQVDGNDVNISTDVDGVGGAITQLELLNAAIENVDEHINVRADVVDRDGKPVGNDGGRGMGLFRAAIYALIALLPVLSNMVGVAGGAIAAATSALTGAGVAAGVLGLGIFGAVQRLSEMKKAGEELTPVMQAVVDAQDALSAAWEGFVDATSPAAYPLIQGFFEILVQLLPQLVPIFNSVAAVSQLALNNLAAFFGGTEWAGILKFFENFGAFAFGSLLDSLGNLALFLLRLSQAFEPFARVMLDGLENVTAGWAGWAEQMRDTDALDSFFGFFTTQGPAVLDLLGSMVQALINIGRGLAPIAGPMIEGLIVLFDVIAEADPGVITAVSLAVAGLFGAIKLGIPAVEGIAGLLGSGGLAGLLGIGGVGVGALAIGGVITAVAIALALVTDTGKPFRDMWDNLNGLWDSAVEAAEDVLDVVKDLYKALQDTGTIDKFQRGIGNVANILSDLMPLIKPLAQVVGVVLLGALWAVGTAFESVGGAISGIVDLIEPVITAIADLFDFLFDSVVNGSVTDMVNGILDWFGKLPTEAVALVTSMVSAVTGKFSELYNSASTIFQNIWNVISTKISGAVDTLQSTWNGAVDWFAGLKDRFFNHIAGWWGNVGTRAIEVKGWIVEKFNDAMDWFSGLKDRFYDRIANWWGNIDNRANEVKGWIVTKFNEAMDWFSGLKDRFADKVATWWSNVDNRAGEVKGWVVTKFNELVDWFGGLGSRISDNTSGMFKGIESAFKSSINTIIGWWNNLSFKMDIPNKIPGLPDSISLSTPNIPMLADGGIATRATLAIVGEGKEQEAILPLSKLEELLDKERNKYSISNVSNTTRNSETGFSSDKMEQLIEDLVQEIRELSSRAPIEYNDYGARRSARAVAEDLWLITKERG